MKAEEFKTLKVGDKVRIVSKKTGFTWNIHGKMDKWLGKIMTIREIPKCVYTRTFVRMEEDKNEWDGPGWAWFAEMIEEKIEVQPTIVEHLIRGNKTIVKLSNGKVGVAQRSPEDEFDIYEGLRLAAERAYDKTKSVVKEVNRNAKIGEYIKIVKPTLDLGLYKKNDILQVDCFGLFDGTVYCKGVLLNGKTPYAICQSEYVVLEGYTPEKK
jgi:uncharacterized protein YlzI (FlbEa/FlbD family)